MLHLAVLHTQERRIQNEYGGENPLCVIANGQLLLPWDPETKGGRAYA